LEEKLIENTPALSEDRLSSMFREHLSIRTKRDRFTRNIDQLTKIKLRLLEYEQEAQAGLEPED
jgi:5'-deoxynucleotidase YfbR-like HD superfamily hydrolase